MQGALAGRAGVHTMSSAMGLLLLARHRTKSATGLLPLARHRTKSATGLLPLALLACSGDHDAPDVPTADASEVETPAPPRCPSALQWEEVATLPAALSELSGLAATPAGLVGHNDSGDGPNLYLLPWGDLSAQPTTIVFADTPPRDVEDIAWQDGDPGRLWVADVGDNAAVRTDTRLYKVFASGETGWTNGGAHDVAFGDGRARDMEAVFWWPGRGALFGLDKSLDALPQLWRFDEGQGQWRAELQLDLPALGSADFFVTAADFAHLAGEDWILVKTYFSLLAFRVLPGVSPEEVFSSEQACVLEAPPGTPPAVLGEAITAWDGHLYAAPEGQGAALLRAVWTPAP